MAHFARINPNGNTVMEVLVVKNSDCGDLPFPESEAIGQKFLNDHCNLEGIFKQTSYNGSFRGRYAGIGDIYDAEKDVFRSAYDVE